MPRYVAFLRAVNVGRGRTVKMDVLRLVFAQLGFSNVASFIASGNIIFETRTRNTELLEKRIEGALLQSLGYELTPFVRTGPKLTRLLELEVFRLSRLGPADQLGIVFLSRPPSALAARALNSFPSAADEFEVHGREVFWLRHMYADGAAYSTVPLDQVLAEPFTIRSMSTVRKIAEKYFLHE